MYLSYQMKKHLFILFFSIGIAAQAQVQSQLGARSNATGNSSLCFTDVWSVYNNPGSFGFLDKTEIGLSFENKFLLSELSTQSLVFGYHTKKSGNFGLHFQQYGFNLYREMNGGFTYGMKLFDNFAAGVSINYHGIFLAENYGSKNTVSAALGLIYQLNKDFSLGMRVQNLSRAQLAEFTDERLPTTFSLGLLYQISKKALWSVEAEKNLIYPINIKSGIEIQAHEILAFRLGVNSYPFQSTFGMGLNLKNFQVDLAAQWHTSLGISPSCGIKYSFN